MAIELVETYDEESLLDGLMDVHVKYAAVTQDGSPEQQEATKALAITE